MATIVDKDTMTRLLAEEFAAVADLGADVDDAGWDTPTCLPGWTVKDQLSHMAAIEMMLDGEPMPAADISHLDHVRNDVGKANEVWIESMRPLPGAEVLDRFRQVTTRRVAALEAMTQQDFDAPSWTPAGPDETYGRFMRIRHFDCFLHEHDMRQALGRPDRDDADHVGSALDEVTAAAGYIVGRKAGMPAGSRVRIALTGSAAREILVEVGERANLVTSLTGDPTVSIELPAVLFLRLAGGRLDGTPLIGRDISLGGDPDLAGRLVANLAYTI